MACLFKTWIQWIAKIQRHLKKPVSTREVAIKAYEGSQKLVKLITKVVIVLIRYNNNKSNNNKTKHVYFALGTRFSGLKAQ